MLPSSLVYLAGSLLFGGVCFIDSQSLLSIFDKLQKPTEFDNGLLRHLDGTRSR